MAQALALHTSDIFPLKAAPVGVRNEELRLEYEKDIGPEEIEQLAFGKSTVKEFPKLKALKESHHVLARLLADDIQPADAARIAGCSYNRVFILQNDPSFQELLAHYKSFKTVVYADVNTQIATVGSMALSELTERLEDKPEEFSNEQLTKLAQATLDRSGHGPTKTIKTINASDVIKEIKARVDAERQGKILSRNTVDAEFEVVKDEE